MSANSETKQFCSFLKEKKYSEALNWLERFSFASFEAIFFYSIKSVPQGQKPPVPTNIKWEFIFYFFKDYLHQSKYFKNVCISSRKREWFEQLFIHNDLICPLLYKRMAEEQPESLIFAIKRNRLPFLKKEQFTEIIKFGEEPKLFDFYKKATTLSILEFFYYANAIKSSRELKGKSIEEVLCLMASWLYYYTWELSVNKNDLDQRRMKETGAVETLNHFFTHFLRCQSEITQDKTFDTEIFQKDLVEKLEEQPPHYEVFLFWNAWNRYVSTYIDEFCFSDSTEINIDENGITNKKYDPVEYEKFYYNEVKLHSYDQFEKEDFELIDTELITSENQKKLLKYLSPELNRDYRNLLDEFTSAVFYKRYKIFVESAQSYALGFVTPYRLLFTAQSEISFKEKKNWNEILKDLSQKTFQKKFQLFPLTEVSLDIKQTINTEFFKEKEKQLEDARITFESFTFDLCAIRFSKHFNRFKEEILFHSAFRFKLGEKVYTFPQICSSTRIHTFITNLALKVHRDGKEQKAVNTQMEKYMSELALEKNIKAISGFKYSFKNQLNEYVPGEIDAVLFDGTTLLGVEFKHSPLKSSLEDISREREITLETAFRQLERFKDYLKVNDKNLNHELKIAENINLKSCNYIGLIVTTNFEYDHEEINGKYYKISWKEWMWILRNMKEDSKLKGVIEIIQSNIYWEELMGI